MKKRNKAGETPFPRPRLSFSLQLTTRCHRLTRSCHSTGRRPFRPRPRKARAPSPPAATAVPPPAAPTRACRDARWGLPARTLLATMAAMPTAMHARAAAAHRACTHRAATRAGPASRGRARRAARAASTAAPRHPTVIRAGCQANREPSSQAKGAVTAVARVAARRRRTAVGASMVAGGARPPRRRGGGAAVFLGGRGCGGCVCAPAAPMGRADCFSESDRPTARAGGCHRRPVHLCVSLSLSLSLSLSAGVRGVTGDERARRRDERSSFLFVR
jgi:hypothetical protein